MTAMHPSTAATTWAKLQDERDRLVAALKRGEVPRDVVRVADRRVADARVVYFESLIASDVET